MSDTPEDSKFPYTRFDIAYGFKDGVYRIPTIKNGAPDRFDVDHSKIYIERNGSDSFVGYWFWFDDEWLKITWDLLLNPSKLKLRRSFNECLASIKDGKDLGNKESRRFTYVAPDGGPDIDGIIKAFHYDHIDAVERLTGGFYCHSCKRGVKEGRVSKKTETKNELNGKF